MKEEDKNKANELIDRFIPEEECGINRSCAKVACVCMADWKKNRMIEKAVEILREAEAVGFGLCSCDFVKRFKEEIEK